MSEQTTMQQRITTRCPACGHDTLFIGSGGHLTCSWLPCQNPGAVADIKWESSEGATRRLAKLHAAITRAIDYREHRQGCEINQTDFCTCGLREAMETLDAAWKALSR